MFARYRIRRYHSSIRKGPGVERGAFVLRCRFGSVARGRTGDVVDRGEGHGHGAAVLGAGGRRHGEARPVADTGLVRDGHLVPADADGARRVAVHGLVVGCGQHGEGVHRTRGGAAGDAERRGRHEQHTHGLFPQKARQDGGPTVPNRRTGICSHRTSN